MEGEREKSILLQMKSNSYMFNKSNKCHYFELSNGEQLSCKLIKSITDPIYDSNFKRLFGVSGAEKRLIDLLNSLLFPGEEVNKIISVKYLSNEFHKFNQKHDKGSLRTDIACEISINGIIYVVAIEMQIGDQGTLNKRIFNYGTSLRNINEYKNCYSIGISVSLNNIDSNSVRLKKKTRKENTILDYIQTIEINIDEELVNIENGVNVIINGKTINNDGKEFIKLFGLRNWATKIGNRYALPYFKDLEIAQNATIKECIEILASIDDYQLLEMIADENYYMDIVTENFNKGHGLGLNEGLIIGAFSFFSITNDVMQIYNYLKDNNVIFGDENQVRTALKGKNKNIIENFINYLKTWEFL